MATRAVDTFTRRVLLAGIVAETGIVVTGGLVRLTGSGLGCPTWPECVEGSYTPVLEQAEGYHKFIEFGNRLLTFAVTAAALAALAVVVRHGRRHGRRPGLVAIAWLQIAGIALQAVLGGITVLVGLHPAWVAGHFLLSVALIASAVVLYERAVEDHDGPAVSLVPPEIRWLGQALVVVALAVVVLGTVVTGSGPHSGDSDEPARFGFDPRTVSWLHADVVLLFIGLVVAFIVAVRVGGGPPQALRRGVVLLGVTLGQGLVGYVQYFTGLPETAVAVHMLGACLVWIAVLRTLFPLRVRSASGTATATVPQRAVAAS